MYCGLALALCFGALDVSAIDAAVRVRAGESLGSGAVFEVDPQRAWVLTCAHVVGAQRAVEVEFWHRGHGSRPLPGVVVAADASVDAAVVAVPTARLGGVPIQALPFAKPEATLQAGAPVFSTGSAQGAWPTTFLGHALGYSQIGLEFMPPPANGRSGSAVVNEAGEIVGVLRARREGGDAVGIATPIQEVYRVWGTAAQRRVASAALCAVVVPAGPVQCPGGACPGAGPTPGPRYDFDRRFPRPGVQREQYDDGYGDGRGDAWPTLPPPATGPKIDIEIAPRPPLPEPAAPAAPPPAADKPEPARPAPQTSSTETTKWTWKGVVGLSAGGIALAAIVALVVFGMAHALHVARYARRGLKKGTKA